MKQETIDGKMLSIVVVEQKCEVCKHYFPIEKFKTSEDGLKSKSTKKVCKYCRGVKFHIVTVSQRNGWD